MLNDQFANFTDRYEANALFDLLRVRDPNKPWPLLPILAFIAPGGGGKSTLIEHLRSKIHPYNARPVLPYAHLDFTLSESPRDFLSIFLNLRNQLQEHKDESGGHLSFPRFDLGASVALETPLDGNLPLMTKEIQDKLTTGLSVFKPMGEMGHALNNLIPIISPLLVGLKYSARIPQIQTLLQNLEKGRGWKWYQTHATKLGLPANSSIQDVLLRLYALSIPGKPGQQGREYLVENILPAAFFADLLEDLVYTDPSHIWNNYVAVVIFLDGIEELLGKPGRSNLAIRLLETLALPEHRERGETDPVLLVVGSRERIVNNVTNGDPQPSFEEHTKFRNHREFEVDAYLLLEQWRQQLPNDRSELELSDLYLPVWLSDFGIEDTVSYLSKIAERKGIENFIDDAMVDAIYAVTEGHPLALALAAEIIIKAKKRGRDIFPDEFLQAKVPRKVDPDHGRESVEEYLLGRLLRQLPKEEQQKLVFCAVPRFLEATLLRTLLQLPNDIEVREQWKNYRDLTFTRAVDEHRIILHPLVRTLLLRQLPPDPDPESDYHRVHTNLREQFHKRVIKGDERACIEEAYHALALGDPGLSIALGVFAQRSNLTLWEPLLEAVAQATVALMPRNGEQQAYDALFQAEQYHNVQDAVTAIIHYTWLLTIPRKASKFAYFLNNLGLSYNNLSIGDREANLKQTIACYEVALQVYTREAFPVRWAMTQNNLGIAYGNLPTEDREANLRQAIACLEAALQVYTREAFPMDWARTRTNLGNAYGDLSAGDREANLRQAIACYEAALQVYTPEAFPIDWATTQSNLGIVYDDLPTGDREANSKQAIASLELALQVYTREAFPMDWARTQYNLGNAYGDLPAGDREANLKQAIACYEAALQVYTPEAFPIDWARTQNSLGAAYCNLPTEDRETNLRQGIAYFEAALQILQLVRVDDIASSVAWNLGTTRNELQSLKQGANDREKELSE